MSTNYAERLREIAERVREEMEWSRLLRADIHAAADRLEFLESERVKTIAWIRENGQDYNRAYPDYSWCIECGDLRSALEKPNEHTPDCQRGRWLIEGDDKR